MDFENSPDAEAAIQGLLNAGIQAQMAKVSSSLVVSDIRIT